MKILHKLIFSLAIVMGSSLAAFAQSDDTKPRPPKDPPPVVTPQPKPSPTPKPHYSSLVVWIKETDETA